MSLTEIQLEAGLGHVSRGTIFDTLRTRGIKAYVEECKFILDEDNKKRRVVSGTSVPRLCRMKFRLMNYRIGATRKKNGLLMASGKI
jgi:hypothetical protein